MTQHTPNSFLNTTLPPRPAHISVTVRLADPSDDVLVRHVRILRDCVALAQKRWDFSIDAAVVLPNEMQLLCAFRDAESGVRSAVAMVTRSFDRHVPGQSGTIWADAGEVLEIPAQLVSMRREFVEAAPVRRGLALSAQEWPYSSAHVGTAQCGDMGVAVA